MKPHGTAATSTVFRSFWTLITLTSSVGVASCLREDHVTQNESGPPPTSTTLSAERKNGGVIEALKPRISDAEADILQTKIEELERHGVTDERKANDPFYAGLKEPEVAAFIGKLKNAIKNGDRQQLASLVRYPLEVRLHGKGKLVSVPNALVFQQNYEAIVTERVRRELESANVANVSANWQGIRVGRGAIWFGGICEDRFCGKYTVMVTRINNHPISGRYTPRE